MALSQCIISKSCVNLKTGLFAIPVQAFCVICTVVCKLMCLGRSGVKLLVLRGNNCVVWSGNLICFHLKKVVSMQIGQMQWMVVTLIMREAVSSKFTTLASISTESGRAHGYSKGLSVLVVGDVMVAMLLLSTLVGGAKFGL